MAGGGAGFLAGLLSGLGGGLLQQEDRKREEASKGKQQYLGVLTKAVEAGDLDPTVGYPLISQIIAEPLKNFTEKGSRGSKGKGGGIESFIAQLADPENMSALLVNAHKTLGGQTGGGPLSGTAPTQDASQQTGTPTGEAETTKLNPNEEAQFQEWAKTNGITDVDHPDSHYDYRGYWQQTKGAPHQAGDHFPDTYKQHGHPTFSTESKYSRGSSDGGTWVGDKFVPGLLSSRQLPSTKPQGAFRSRAEREAQELEFGRKKTEGEEAARVTGKARGELLAIDSYLKSHSDAKADEAAFVLFGRQRKGPSGVKVVPGIMTADQIKKADPDPKDLDGNSFTPEEGASYQRVQIPTDEGGTEFRYIPGPTPKQAGGASGILTGMTTAEKERLGDRLMTKYNVTLGQASEEQIKSLLPEVGASGKRLEDATIKRAERTPVTVIREGEKKAEAKDIAQAIIDGDQPPDLSRLYGDAPKVRAELARKGFNLTKSLQDWNATQRYLSSLNGPQQLRFRQAVESMDGYLTSIESLAKQWQGGKFPLLNKASLSLAKNGAYGPKAASIATQLETQIADATADLAVVYRGGGTATSDALKLAEKNLKSDWSQKVLLDNVKLIRDNIKIRKGSMNPGAVGVSGPTGQAETSSASSSKPLTITTPNGTFTIESAK